MRKINIETRIILDIYESINGIMAMVIREDKRTVYEFCGISEDSINRLQAVVEKHNKAYSKRYSNTRYCASIDIQ